MTATEETTVSHCPSWVSDPLYKFLCESLPTFRTDARNVLDIPRLSIELSMTEEGIYKWFRKGHITMKNARRLNLLSVKSHAEAKTDPPSLFQFYKFVN